MLLEQINCKDTYTRKRAVLM